MNFNTKPFISVITVVLNDIKGIEQTILSIINQTYHDIEYIIIDGGSTDGTVDIIKKYADKITYWISEPDKGIYDAMNKGIVSATGDWINFMNAGDRFVDENVLSQIFCNEQSDSYDVLFGNTLLINPKKNTQHNIYAENYTIKRPMSFCHQSVFVKTRWYKQFLFDENYKICADKDFFIKISRNGAKFLNTNLFISEILMFGFSTQQRYKNLMETNDIFMKYDLRTRIEGLCFNVKAIIEEIILFVIRR